MLPMIFLVLGFVWAPQADDVPRQLPAWTQEPAEANLFVVKTEEVPTHFTATESLLPTVRSAVVEWSLKHLGSDCRPIIENMPLEEFRQFIFEDQEIVHKERKKYDDPEMAKRMEAEYEDFYQGYVRVQIDDDFCARFGEQLREHRLKKRLCGTFVGALFTFGSLGILWVWFFMKRITRGLYISRLRWIVGGLIGLLLVVCYGLCQLMFW